MANKKTVTPKREKMTVERLGRIVELAQPIIALKKKIVSKQPDR